MDLFPILCGVYYLLIPSFGLFCHSFIQFHSWTASHQLTAFNFLCATKSFAALTFCMGFVFWSAPVCFFGRTFIWTNLVLEKIMSGCIHVSITYIHIGQFTCTMNRFIAVFSISIYQRIFSLRNIKASIWSIMDHKLIPKRFGPLIIAIIMREIMRLEPMGNSFVLTESICSM